ncbi:aromatic acid exporter family protein [Rossellomorea marisflavi]|uniref:aromatic acid exporter family protein n=1 Tax=Rossellomorea marisflavi TaxID=189381 RepID=UPI0027A19701|nr:aromatic acid exporter family protein [Rossellomorea marisflavi]UTE74465.1 aromatic acid exporter family protein [Rossellomorea marisflavi]
MLKIGYRTLKTGIGTALAISVAQWLHLDNFVSAGILTILCIQNTKKKSINASWSRFLACVIAMLMSGALFELISYHPAVIGLVLLIFIPITVALNISEGIVTSSVIILHVYSAGSVSLGLYENELGIILTGIGIALLMNLYMPSVENKLVEYQERIEENFYKIFCEMINYLKTNDGKWDGKEITETEKLLREAKTLAFKDVENHFLRHENLYYLYFKMREKQFYILQRILPIAASLSQTVEQGHRIADFLEELRDHIHPGNTALFYLKMLYDMKVEFEQMELPKTREEFETRAALYQFVREMEEYLQLKSSFKGIKKSRTFHTKKSATS